MNCNDAYGFVYKTTNLINKKFYIGQTTQKGYNFNTYLGSGRLLKKAIKKYGKENFKRDILYECNNQEHLDRMERFFIFYTKPTYNIDLGGLGVGHFSKEHKEKIGNKLRGKNKSISHIENLKKSHTGKFLLGESKSAKSVICIELNRTFSCILEASIELKINKHSIGYSCNGKRKTGGGYHWSFIDKCKDI